MMLGVSALTPSPCFAGAGLGVGAEYFDVQKKKKKIKKREKKRKKERKEKKKEKK